MWAWPRSSLITASSTPCSRSRVAVECRRSWKRMRRRPALRRSVVKVRVRLVGSIVMNARKPHRSAARRHPSRGRVDETYGRVHTYASQCMNRKEKPVTERVVLAYSGGLDTSVAIGWIAEETGAEVIAVAVDVGQGGEDLDVIRKRALACGAVEAEVADAKDEFADEYCLPAIKANALYMDRYPLVSALSRPTIVKHLVAAAKKHGATTVAHGCTGKGNDQVRFEAGIVALAPDLKCIAPVRDYAMTRDKAIAFAEKANLPIATTKKSPYSIDQNVFGRAVETGFLEDIWNGPIEDIYEYTENPATPRDADEVIITFKEGVPVAIDGKPVTVLQAIQQLNERAGAQGIGRIDMVEDRLVGIKSR